ncbi:MAG TPA: DUF2127 domain-containing protein [Candidatus Saccharimonadales bacterium]|nr:DUF2127 domain-containing protein [Candidatus Saccharimonadales bacterium]
MPWFHPKTLLDKTYEIGILLKGIDGVIELLGAAVLIFVPAHYFESFARALTDVEAGSSAHGFISAHILQIGHRLSEGHNFFAIAFLLTHGLVKVVLVVCLLRQKLWAYPFGLVALSLFLVYQLYEMIMRPTFGMGFLTVLDAVIIWLVWREWQKVKADRAQKPEPANA